MSDNWVVQHLLNMLETWNEKLAEVWALLTTRPEAFKGGGIWRVILTINGSLQAVGLALLVLFFLACVVRTSTRRHNLLRLGARRPLRPRGNRRKLRRNLRLHD